MRLCVKNKNHLPWGEVWFFTHPESGIVLRAKHWDKLYDAVREHHRQRNYPIGLEFESWMEDQVCKSQPDECVPCRGDGKLLLRPQRITADDVLRGTRVLASFVAGGRKTVSEDEANRRAKICGACPMNVSVRWGCGFPCGELASLVQSITGRASPVGATLSSCGICHCLLSAAVWLELKDQCVGMSDQMKKDFAAMKENGCWKQC